LYLLKPDTNDTKGGKTMGFLSDKDASTVRERFAKEMVNGVTISVFVQDKQVPGDCDYCDDTALLLEEIAGLTDKIKLKYYKYPTDIEAVAKYGIDMVPAIVLEQDRDLGIRFYGIPAGYEFITLLEGIIDVSRGEPQLSAGILAQLDQVREDVVIKVFVTPT